VNPARKLDRISGAPPVAVVDIGSNSVRMVVYDGLRRAPSPMFNEKVLCGLGRGVAETGALDDKASERALLALTRFRALIVQMKVEEVFAVATAAVREASNGRDFIKRAEKCLKADIAVLTGKQEATFAAHGVLSATPDADGVVGDLGGGSLELVDVRGGKLRDGVTLPLGPLRIIGEIGSTDTEAARAFIDEQLDKAGLLAGLHGRTLYAVGGAWRNLARLHMAQVHYPLTIVQGYTLDHSTARSLANFVSQLSPDTLKGIESVSKSRAETLPLSALVLERILARSTPAHFTTSVYGVREGVLYKQLNKRVRDTDPLLNACWDFAKRYARSPNHELELCKWTDPLFNRGKMAEAPLETRLRHAACMLADISWRANPDYRSGRALTIISQASIVGVDHPGRVFLALAVFFRYQGVNTKQAPRELAELISEDELERARVLAGAMRLAYLLTGAMTGLLPKIKLFVEDKKLVLAMPNKLSGLYGETVQKRFNQLAGVMGLEAEVRR
jgi:exopolyphosphatase/guanosine-5'-triphosphate,3'-diphosphate pyrophosphatase